VTSPISARESSTGSYRRIVIVSGAPGAGKSTLALPLSEELGFSLLSKDHIKETLHDSLGGRPPATWHPHAAWVLPPCT
jgi:predicted kinase